MVSIPNLAANLLNHNTARYFYFSSIQFFAGRYLCQTLATSSIY
jgi:hypothetical protein